MKTNTSDKHLLIIACTKEKNPKGELVSAWERYTGPVFRLLKKIIREPSQHPYIDIVIISGKYGFLRPETKIICYDQPMTSHLAHIHQEKVTVGVLELLKKNTYSGSFVILVPEYLITLELLELPNAVIKTSLGSDSFEELKKWLSKVLQENAG